MPKTERPRDLTASEGVAIARVMHLLILDEIFRTTRWKSPNAVFHGGTALAVAQHSERFSEDLDFMVDKKAYEALDASIARVAHAVEMRIAAVHPGSRVALVGPRTGEVAHWEFRWSHPERRQVVKVKAEFFISDASLLSRYRSRNVVPVLAGVPGAIAVRTSIPVPALISSWADKIKAIATRPSMKWRDLYDLSFVANHLRPERIDDATRTEAILSTALLYGASVDTVLDGLVRVQESGSLEDEAAFSKDMRRWLSEETWEMNQDRGMFADMLADARDEIQRAVELLRPLSSRMTP